MRDKMIPDRIVVGVFDRDLSQKLQIDYNLTLSKVIKIVRMSKLIQEQEEIQGRRLSSELYVNQVRKQLCPGYGGSCKSRFVCPAQNVLCHNCS